MNPVVYMIDLDGRGLHFAGTGPDWVRYWDAAACRFPTAAEAEAYRANCWEPHTRVVPMESGR